eukprot:Ihof_evm1s31 gene=Ihof_evmTU1s31
MIHSTSFHVVYLAGTTLVTWFLGMLLMDQDYEWTDLLPVSLFILFVEVVWAVYYQWRARVLCTTPVRQAPFPFSEKTEVIDNIISDVSAGHYYPGWFNNTPLSDIRRDNVLELISTNFYHKRPCELSLEERKEINKMLSVSKADSEHNFPRGLNESIRSIQHTLDPLPVYPMPFLLFACTLAIHSVASLLMLGLRFERLYLRVNKYKLYYWHRPQSTHLTSEPIAKPLVFLHGIGVGLFPYFPMLMSMWRDGRAVVCLDMPYVGMSPVEEVPSMDDMADGLSRIIIRHRLGKCSFVGHSYGTFVLARMCKMFPDLIHAATFVDPVCFCLYLPDVVYNFIYRTPKSLIEVPRYFLVSRNLYFLNVLCRNFWWFQVCMWPKDLPSNLSVVLSMDDEITPAPAVRDWLSKYSTIRPTMLSTMHAQWLFSPTATASIVRAEQTACDSTHTTEIDSRSLASGTHC